MEKVLNYISRIINLIFCKKSLFEYEQICLTAWKNSLTPHSSNKLEKQLDKFDCVERHVYKLKTVFHCIADSKYAKWLDDDLFITITGEGKVFTGKLFAAEGDIHMAINFSIYLHNGRFSSIDFSSSPEALKSFLSENMSISNSKTIINL